jgi:peptidylprolyl isomerase
MRSIYGTILISIILLMGACNDPQPKKQNKALSKKELIDNNRKSVRVESDQIDLYAKRRGWDMEKTRTGLRYLIYEKKNVNQYPQENNTVSVRYSVSLINGEKIYTSSADDPASFVVGHDNVESGLQEGIRFMSVGDKAILIIPAHLAHGYTGDFNKIPRSSTVIFDIELLEIK